MGEMKYFFSYARKDSEFVLKLAQELREAGVNLWVDKMDILGGRSWDRAVEEALKSCQGMILVLSPDSVISENVKDEYTYFRDKEKLIIPVLIRLCEIPFRLARLHYIDFTNNYDIAVEDLLRALSQKQTWQTAIVDEEPSKEETEPLENRPMEATQGEEGTGRIETPGDVGQVADGLEFLESAAAAGLEGQSLEAVGVQEAAMEQPQPILPETIPITATPEPEVEPIPEVKEIVEERAVETTRGEAGARETKPIEAAQGEGAAGRIKTPEDEGDAATGLELLSIGDAAGSEGYADWAKTFRDTPEARPVEAPRTKAEEIKTKPPATKRKQKTYGSYADWAKTAQGTPEEKPVKESVTGTGAKQTEPPDTHLQQQEFRSYADWAKTVRETPGEKPAEAASTKAEVIKTVPPATKGKQKPYKSYSDWASTVQDTQGSQTTHWGRKMADFFKPDRYPGLELITRKKKEFIGLLVGALSGILLMAAGALLESNPAQLGDLWVSGFFVGIVWGYLGIYCSKEPGRIILVLLGIVTGFVFTVITEKTITWRSWSIGSLGGLLGVYLNYQLMGKERPFSLWQGRSSSFQGMVVMAGAGAVVTALSGVGSILLSTSPGSLGNWVYNIYFAALGWGWAGSISGMDRRVMAFVMIGIMIGYGYWLYFFPVVKLWIFFFTTMGAILGAVLGRLVARWKGWT